MEQIAINFFFTDGNDELLDNKMKKLPEPREFIEALVDALSSRRLLQCR